MKTKKKKLIVLGVIILAAIVIVILYNFRFLIIGTSSREIDAKMNADFEIADIKSSIDMDHDDIDDQTDILQGARNYIATHPKYKSEYYETGYSDDEYGVCTDVVAHALLNAGYDLMTLVNEDINTNPDDYDIEEPDINIDFRRVRNLRVYFKHAAAIELTTDVNDIKEWQGGDIVIFEKHIGVVSDKRNDNGVAYVIHHYSSNQASYEEDILEKRNDIVGHYRISE